MRIKQTQTPAEIEEVRKLLREYEAFLDVDLCFQDFEEELAGLPGEYSRPSGDLLIALDGDKTVECVAVRKLCSFIRGSVLEERSLTIRILFPVSYTGSWT
jgi:hypothetical protein